MLYILFSPSEGKKEGGETKSLKLFGEIKSRDEILQEYVGILKSDDEAKIKKLFGFKTYTQCKPYLIDIFTAPTLKAVERYDGVAYNHLEFETLPSKAQHFLQKRLVIFSNLFGPILGSDTIPIYKVKQGNAVGEIVPQRFYKERFSNKLDELLDGHDVLDLRAGYYDKFYTITQPYTTLKFLKNGKVVSHWAKAYRGIVAREIAKNEVDSLDSLGKLKIPFLACEEIKTTKNKTEIIYKILK